MKKKIDPALIALQDQLGKALADFERWYSRLVRAVRACEKHKQRVKRLRGRITKFSGIACTD